MTAHHDLSAAVREALAQSDHLIVICSPRAARSEWVGREIEYFRAVHGDGRILAALIEGDPDTAFPPALRTTAAGQASVARPFSPIARVPSAQSWTFGQGEPPLGVPHMTRRRTTWFPPSRSMNQRETSPPIECATIVSSLP